MTTQVLTADTHFKVGQYACIAQGSYCTAQGKVTFVGQNGQVTIHMGGNDILTGTPIPRYRRQ